MQVCSDCFDSSVCIGYFIAFCSIMGVSNVWVVKGERSTAAVGLLYPFLETTSEPHSLCIINNYFTCLTSC